MSFGSLAFRFLAMSHRYSDSGYESIKHTNMARQGSNKVSY